MIEVFDERTINADLDDIPNVPDRVENQPAYVEKPMGKFKPVRLHADWRRVGDEEWKLYYLALAGPMWQSNGTLSEKRDGTIDYTFNGEDKVSLIDAQWIAELLKHYHPMTGFNE